MVVADTRNEVAGQMKRRLGAQTGGPELEQKGRDEQMTGNLETSATKAKHALKKGV
jgi:uncharacterized protein YjbJ (UPF0337 family)